MNVFDLFATLTLDTSGYENELDQAKKKSNGFGQNVLSVAKNVAKIGTAATAAAATATIAISKLAVSNYAEYEQLAGGVETLFDTSANKVLEYANEAYKSAGLSANDYMETVTSFSASLLQSLGGDTEKAADYADMAIRDMSDNANKMGSSMESIQNAYQGFAKQNYTMLDNLKLGYGGTKSEMERLVEDAEKLNTSFRAQRDETGALTLSYTDVVDAIHIVQDNMGITGTTAKEASTTIQGSIGSMKAAWSNLMTGLADENANLAELIDNLVMTVAGKNGEGGVINSILPAAERAMDGIATLITTAAPQLLPMAIDMIIAHLPDIIEAGTQILVALITGLVQALPQLVEAIPQILKSIVGALEDGWPQINEAGVALLKMLGEGILAGWEWIEEKLAEVVERIKGVFDFDWTFPKPKLPHFKVDWRDLGLISIPDVSIEWYKKAYDNPYMFTKPTLMGFGDGNGGEMVYGHQSLLNDIKTAMRDTMGSEQPITIIVQSVLDGQIIGENVTRYQRQKARASG